MVPMATAAAKHYETIAEGKARIFVPKSAKVSSAMPVFYNPAMKSNRDITILVMAAAMKLYGIKKWQAADPMAATGIRGIRMMLELGSSRIKQVTMNDHSATAVKLIKNNLRLNKIKSKKVAVANTEANKFLLGSSGFNYIDIDPFGYPGLFLDAAMKRMARNGILAVTATDTSALAGTAPDACLRKYMAVPLKNSFMHETGVRVLIRLVQLIGGMHEKAMLPIFSYHKEHYIRAFFLCNAGAHKADRILRLHNEISNCNSCGEKGIFTGRTNCGGCGKTMVKAGPMWTGALFDRKLVAGMITSAAKASVDQKTKEFLSVIAEEAAGEERCGIGFYSTEDICQKHKIGIQPKTSAVIERLRKAGFTATPTHCSNTGIKTNAPRKAVIAACQQKDL